MTNNPIRRAACRLLRSGEAEPAEIARLAGLSRQLVRYWAESEHIDWQAARASRLARLWSRLMTQRAPD